MRLTKYEATVEEIVLLLLKLKVDQREPDRTYGIAVNDAADMAFRANKGWWEIGGKPHFNRRMKRIKRLMKK